MVVQRSCCAAGADVKMLHRLSSSTLRRSHDAMHERRFLATCSPLAAVAYPRYMPSTNRNDTDLRRSSAGATGNQARPEDNPIVPQQMSASAPTPVGGGKSHGEFRPRTTGNQRRRRQRDRRVDTEDGGVNGEAPVPPHQMQHARRMEPQASASSRGAAGRQRSRAAVGPASGVDSGLRVTERTATISHVSRNGERADAHFGGTGPEALLPGVEEGEVQDQEDAFPALPRASGQKKAPGEASPPLPLPSEAATAGRVELNYSSLAERLAAEAAAAAAAATAAAKTNGGYGGAAESFSRLSVLPSFGGDWSAEANHRDAANTIPLDLSGAQNLAPASPALAGPEDVVREKALVQERSLPSDPPSQQTLADRTRNRKMKAGASVETVALRARLRERWFRLEAIRKAQRQGEAVERELMAAEDVAVIRGDHERGRNAAAAGGHQDLDHKSGGVGDDDSSGDDRDSEEDGTSSGAGGADDQGRPQSPRSSSTDATRASQANEAAEQSSEANSTTDVPGDTTAGALGGAGQSREVSAAGLAAIRRSEAAADAPTEMQSVLRSSSSSAATQGTSVGLKTEELEDIDPSASLRHENGKQLPILSEGGVGDPGCDDVVEAILGEGEQVDAACEAGMTGFLNDLLVRSAGRAADGKDKV